MKLVNLIPLKEIDFRNQDAFDSYNQQHKLRPDTKVTIAGKTTTAGQAAQKSEPVKGSSVFGNTPKKDDEILVIYKNKARINKTKSFTDAKAAQKFSDANSGTLAQMKNGKLVAYPKTSVFTKDELPNTNRDTVINDPTLSKSAGGAKDKSITDIKADKQVDVSMVSKSILPNLRIADASGYPDKDAAELKQKLDKGDNGVYTRTSPHGGNIVFKDGTRFQVFRPHDAKKTKSTTIYASKR
jgi:hypothetical protein